MLFVDNPAGVGFSEVIQPNGSTSPEWAQTCEQRVVGDDAIEIAFCDGPLEQQRLFDQAYLDGYATNATGVAQIYAFMQQFYRIFPETAKQPLTFRQLQAILAVSTTRHIVISCK